MQNLKPPTEIARPDSLGGREATRNGIDWYRRQYNAGWKAGSSGSDSAKYNSGSYSYSWEDGYLDAAVGRAKWHLAHCPDHDTCGEG